MKDLHLHLSGATSPVVLFEMVNETGIKMKTRNYREFVNAITMDSNKVKAYISANEFDEIFNNLGRGILAKCQDISEALTVAKTQKPQNAKRIVACGSLYFAGEVLGELN